MDACKDYEEKLECQNRASHSKVKNYPQGMTYDEIASSRTTDSRKDQAEKIEEADNNSTDTDSQASIEPIDEKDIKATGQDPYDKLNYKTGEVVQQNDKKKSLLTFYYAH